MVGRRRRQPGAHRGLPADPNVAAPRSGPAVVQIRGAVSPAWPQPPAEWFSPAGWRPDPDLPHAGQRHKPPFVTAHILADGA
jgi:hypothetical protein